MANELQTIGRQVTDVRTQVETNSSNIEQLRTAVGKLQETSQSRPTLLSITQRGSESNIRPTGPTFLAGARTLEQEMARKIKFKESRRTIRVWPITGSTDQERTQNLQDFLSGALLLSRADIDGLGIDAVTRVRSQPGGRIHHEVRVSFHHHQERDIVARKGNMLAKYVDAYKKPLAGIRMDIPEYLGAEREGRKKVVDLKLNLYQG